MTDDVARDRADLDDLSLLRDTPHRERLRRVMDRVAPFGMLRSELADAVFDIESAALAAGVLPPPAAPGLREAAQAAYLELLAAPFVHDGADESSEAITEREERLTALDDLRAALAETPGGEK